MNRNLFFLSLLLPACVWAQEPMQDIKIDVLDFSELKVSDAIPVIYQQNSDSAGWATFQATPQMISAVTFANKDGRMELRLNDHLVSPGVVPTVTIYSSFLTKIENNGDSTVTALTLAKAPAFTAILQGNGRLVIHDIQANNVEGFLKTGNGTLVLQGQCNQAKIKFMGAGTVQADNLQAVDVSVSASGTGQVGVWPQKILRVKGVGSTTIYYRGTPEIKKSLVVGLKLKQLP